MSFKPLLTYILTTIIAVVLVGCGESPSEAIQANLLKGKWIEFGDTVKGGPETWEFNENGTVDIIDEGKKTAGKYQVTPPDTVSITVFGMTISAKISKSGNEITSEVGNYKKEGNYQSEAKPVEFVAEVATQVPKAAKVPDMPIQIAAQSGHIELVKQHIAAGTDVNAKDKTGGTALISATLNGQKEIIELLIANKADLNIGLEKGKWTALHFASTPMSTKGFSDLEILEVLLKSGAAVNSTDEEGQTPLDVAISSVGGQFLGDNNTHTLVTKLLRKHGAKTGEELKAEGK